MTMGNNGMNAGWYPVNESRELGYWDGSQWTGDRVPNPDAPHRNTSKLAVVGFGVLLVVLLVVWVGADLLLG